MLPVGSLSPPPAQVTSIVAPARCASCTVRTNDCIRSGSAKAFPLKKMRTNCGWSATTFASMSGRFCSVTPTSRLIAA